MWFKMLKLGDYPGLSEWALNAIIGILIRGKQRKIIPQRKKSKQCNDRSRHWSDVAVYQEMLAALRCWMRQETNSP